MCARVGGASAKRGDNKKNRNHDLTLTHQHLSPQRHQPILELFCPSLLHSVVAGTVVIAGWWGWGKGRRHWVWGRNTGVKWGQAKTP